MKVSVKKSIGGSDFIFEAEEEKDIEAIAKVASLSNAPIKCGLCQSENVHLSSNKAQGYTFVKVLCEDCNGRSQLGQYKEGGFFWKEWEKYEPPVKEG